MLPRHHPDGIRIAFDDHRLVTNAGLVLLATLAFPPGPTRNWLTGGAWAWAWAAAQALAFLLSVWTGHYRCPSGAHHADLGL